MDTLVLSNTYQPVARISWQKAITLFWSGKAEIIEEYEDWKVRSITLEFKVPSIIRFLRKIRDRKRVVKFSRENVYSRDKGCCQYCGHKILRHEATYDHVTPRSQGGQTKWENVVICCIPCNQKKGGRTPVQAHMRLLSVPIKPKTLPDTFRLTFLLKKNIPESWKNWLQSYSYWNNELVQDGE